MAEGSLRTISFRRFLKTVGIDSDSAERQSATLPSKEAKSTSTFYSYSNEDIVGCDVPSKSGWLLKQSRGVLRSWQEKWFVLNGNYLMQYSTNDETHSPQSLQFLKNHSVKEVVTLDTYSDDSQKFMFEICPNVDGSSLSLKSQETFTLAAKSPDERRCWVQVLRQVLYRDNGGAIFGQSLEDTLKYEQEKDPSRKVPEIVQMCVEFLSAHGLETEGLFRLAGRVSVVRKLREAFDAGGKRPSLDDVDVHSVASLLKSYLCDLPQPLIPVAHYDKVMHIVTREQPLDEHAAIEALSDAVLQLPPANYHVIRYLCRFLCDVAGCSEVNRMTASNLAMIFSPCFIKPEIDDPALLAGTAVNRTTAVQDMIEHFTAIFPPHGDTDCDKADAGVHSLVDMRADVNGEEVCSSSLNESVKCMPPDIVMDAGHLLDVDNTEGKDLIKLRSSRVCDDKVTTPDCTVRQPSVTEPVTEIGRELYVKIRWLQQQLDAERCSVDELRQQLVAERTEAARQADMLARKLDKERMATTNAVMRVMELQTQLEQYNIKFGPLT